LDVEQCESVRSAAGSLYGLSTRRRHRIPHSGHGCCHERTALCASGSAANPAEVARIAGAASDLDLAGPVLAGRGTAWAEREPDGSLAVRAGLRGSVRIVHRVPVPTLTAEESSNSEYETRVIQTVRAIAGSSKRIAFVRNAMLARIPRCLPACRKPSQLKPLFAELWAGSVGGPLTRVAGTEARCGVARPMDVDVSDAKLCTRNERNVAIALVRVSTRSYSQRGR
jgi:hypothetical protein